jgi:hypothetical protein
MEWWHAFFQIAGMLAVGYIISRLVLKIPIVKKSFIYHSKDRIDRTDNPNNYYYDYKNQAWVKNGVYLRCGHPKEMNCGCYGRLHKGEKIK